MRFGKSLRRFKEDHRAISIGAILGLVLGVTVAAYTLPDAITALMNASKYTGDASGSPAQTLMTTVGGIVVAIVFLVMLIRSGKKGD